jgi:hypothetical protein
MNSDTLIAHIDPINASFGTSFSADSSATANAHGWIFDEITDANLSVISYATSSVNIGGGGPTGVTNGCSDGGPWMAIRANELVGAVADEGGWIKSSEVFNLAGTLTGPPTVANGGTLSATGTPVMEVTICTPTVTTQAASSTALAPAMYGFGFGDTGGAGMLSSSGGGAGPNNGAYLAATNTDNWVLVNKSVNSASAIVTSTGISTTTTRTSPETFRIAMTATATYAFRFNYNTGLWDSIAVNTTKQSPANMKWFIGVQKPNVAAGRHDFLFRNLKVWYSPTYRF